MRLPNEQQDHDAGERQRGDQPDEVEKIATPSRQPFSSVDVVGGGALAAPEDGHDDREADRDLGRGDDQREEHDHLAADVVQRLGERDEREVRRR